MSCVGIIFSHCKLLTQTSFTGKGDKILQRWNAAAYMVGSLKTVTNEILSPYGLYLYLYGCRHNCIYCVTLSVQLRNATTTRKIHFNTSQSPAVLLVAYNHSEYMLLLRSSVELSEVHRVCAPTSIHVQVQVQSIGEKDCMCDCFQIQLPHHVGSRTPSLGGAYNTNVM